MGLVLLVLLSLLVTWTSGQLLSEALGDHCVLPREPQEAWVWGIAPARGATVDVVLKTPCGVNVTRRVIAQGGDGTWNASLGAVPWCGLGGTLVASSEGITQASYDVLVGDLLLCGGQSNMQFSMVQTFNASLLIEQAASGHYSRIRLFTVSLAARSSPCPHLLPPEQVWSVPSLESVGNSANFSYFSAVCWLSASRFYDNRATAGIPLGLVASNYGGTLIQSWMESSLGGCPNTPAHAPLFSSPPSSVLSSSSSSACPQVKPPGPNDHPSVLWNAMIWPLRLLRMTAVIWYQGESNTGSSTQVVEYACQYRALMQQWRQLFNNSLMPFVAVQLAPWAGPPFSEPPENLPPMRLVQQSLATLSNRSALASAADLGDYNGPWYSIHPRNKLIVGERVARRLSVLLDGDTSAPAFAPVGTAFAPINASTLVISFAFPNSGTNLQFMPGQQCPPALVNATTKTGNFPVCQAFRVVYKTRKFFSHKNVTIYLGPQDSSLSNDGRNVFLHLPPSVQAKDCVQVAYADSVWPTMFIYTSDSYQEPLLPFVL